jgi:dienelactone hydrolase
MMSNQAPSRRAFLSLLGLAPAAPALGEAKPSAPADTPRKLAATGADLGSLFPEVEKIAALNSPAYSWQSGRFRTAVEFRKAGRDKVLELMLYDPPKVEPKAEVVAREDCGDHVREKVLFNTAEHFRVPAYVLVPKKLRGRAPAVIDLHSHGGMFLFGKEKVIDLGSNHAAMTDYHKRNYDGRPTATALVRRGYVVITIDAFMFGERRVMMDADLKEGWDRSRYSLETVARLNQVCRAKEATLVKGLVLGGTTWAGIVFRDDLRTVDYLLSRPEVDPKRIGCLGVSMGGYRALFLAALDSRIAAACVTGFMSTTGPMIRAHLDTHSWVHFLPGLHRYLDWPDVAGLAAPRPLLVQQCARDKLFPLVGMKDAVKKIASVYQNARAKERFSGRFYDVPHQFSRAMQDDAFAWLDRHLAHKPN